MVMYVDFNLFGGYSSSVLTCSQRWRVYVSVVRHWIGSRHVSQQRAAGLEKAAMQAVGRSIKADSAVHSPDKYMHSHRKSFASARGRDSSTQMAVTGQGELTCDQSTSNLSNDLSSYTTHETHLKMEPKHC